MKYPLLGSLRGPEDIKHFSLKELNQLATEIRNRILSVMSVNGGHLASNLGSIEFSIALHFIFHSPKDKFIFDVSHQTYPHKLLTGRNDRFDGIRQYKGLMGFCNPKESLHDHFYAGHAGTALSLGLGMARARDLSQGDEHILPVIGDATLTCGLSLEALNNVPHELRRFIVILNDNAMSISHNVGSIKNILSRLLSNPRTNKWIYEFEHLVAKIPQYGTKIANQGQRLARSLKNLVSSASFFEQFGLAYVGPIDGHDIKKMISVFEALKDAPMPVIIHIYTKKGYGVDRAEKDPIAYHGVKPFDPATCEFLPSPSKLPTFPKVFGKQIVKMAEKDPSLVAVTPAMSLGSCLDPFREKFPSRFFDTGIAEGHAVTFCGGLSKGKKLKVICSIYATFLQRALDNLFQDVCLQGLPVVFAIDRAGISGPDGPTHHGVYDIGFLKTMPNMVICQPRDGHVLKELLESAFSWNRPTAIRYPNMTTEENEKPLSYRPLGKGELIEEGEDLLIIALGHQCQAALKMRSLLGEQGISAAVLDPIFIKPLDTDLLGQLLLTHQRIVTIEEHSLKGGLASEINYFLIAQGFSHIPTVNFGIPEAFLEQGSYEELIQEIGMTPEKMVQCTLAHFGFREKKRNFFMAQDKSVT